MSDPITQMRLSLRLDKYISDFKQKNLGKDDLSREEWDTARNAAEAARTNSNLTPQLIDDVRIVVHKL